MKEFNFDKEYSKRKGARQDKYKDSSKKRLLNNIKKKFDTTTIGSLAIIEEFFGELWGHGVHYNELTEEDRKEEQIVWIDNSNGTPIGIIRKPMGAKRSRRGNEE